MKNIERVCSEGKDKIKTGFGYADIFTNPPADHPLKKLKAADIIKTLHTYKNTTLQKQKIMLRSQHHISID
jgi:hypothetical protein